MYDNIDATDTQTESDFNVLDCSGDTIAECKSNMINLFYTDMELNFDISDCKEESKIWDIEMNFKV